MQRFVLLHVSPRNRNKSRITVIITASLFDEKFSFSNKYSRNGVFDQGALDRWTLSTLDQRASSQALRTPEISSLVASSEKQSPEPRSLLKASSDLPRLGLPRPSSAITRPKNRISSLGDAHCVADPRNNDCLSSFCPCNDRVLHSLDCFVHRAFDLLSHGGYCFLVGHFHNNRDQGDPVPRSGLFDMVSVYTWAAYGSSDSLNDLSTVFSFELQGRIHSDNQ